MKNKCELLPPILNCIAGACYSISNLINVETHKKDGMHEPIGIVVLSAMAGALFMVGGIINSFALAQNSQTKRILSSGLFFVASSILSIEGSNRILMKSDTVEPVLNMTGCVLFFASYLSMLKISIYEQEWEPFLTKYKGIVDIIIKSALLLGSICFASDTLIREENTKLVRSFVIATDILFIVAHAALPLLDAYKLCGTSATVPQEEPLVLGDHHHDVVDSQNESDQNGQLDQDDRSGQDSDMRQVELDEIIRGDNDKSVQYVAVRVEQPDEHAEGELNEDAIRFVA